MILSRLPRTAAWTHSHGFEVSFPSQRGLRGHTTAIESGTGLSVGYAIEVDEQWRTTTATITNLTVEGWRSTTISQSRDGRWAVDGIERPELDGCSDLDLESSAVTNTLPVHRLTFALDKPVAVSSAYVRADDLRVERLEQTYALTSVSGSGIGFHYEAPRFDYAGELVYDAAGLILEYPGIATRSG